MFRRACAVPPLSSNLLTVRSVSTRWIPLADILPLVSELPRTATQSRAPPERPCNGSSTLEASSASHSLPRRQVNHSQFLGIWSQRAGTRSREYRLVQAIRGSGGLDVA